MRKDAAIQVRLEEEMDDRLQAIAKKFHLSKSAVIRMVMEQFMEHCDNQGGRIVMPPEFKSFDVVDRDSK